MPEITLTVETADLRNALTAVTPFTVKDIDSMSRVTLHCTESVTTVSATNGSAAALAAVSTWTLSFDTDSDDNAAVFDLSAIDARKILQVFKGKPGDADEPGEEVRIDVDAETVTITDTSGMFEGQQLVLPRLPMLEHTPNVHRFLGQFLHEHPRSPEGALLPLFGPNVALFVGACKVYGKEMVLELHSHGDREVCLVRAGESFIGALTVIRWDEEDAQTRATWREGWNRRIPRSLQVVR